MIVHTLSTIGCYAIALLGGVYFLVAPFSAPGRVAPHWIRVALWLSGSSCIMWGLSGFLLHYGSRFLSKNQYHLMQDMKMLFGGMCIGIIVLLFASGQFLRAFATNKAP
jgi:hypothetical protein